jgi:hypothetical protein
MGIHGASGEFGKELGLVHEAVVTGRKVGVGGEFWSILAHDREKFRLLVASLYSFKVWACYHWPFNFDEWASEHGLLCDSTIGLHETRKIIEQILKRESGKNDQEVTLSFMNFNDLIQRRGYRNSLPQIAGKITGHLKKLGYRLALLHEVLSLLETHSQELPVIADESIAIIGAAMESNGSSSSILPLLTAGSFPSQKVLFLYQDSGFNCWPTTGWVAAVKL